MNDDLVTRLSCQGQGKGANKPFEAEYQRLLGRRTEKGLSGEEPELVVVVKIEWSK